MKTTTKARKEFTAVRLRPNTKEKLLKIAEEKEMNLSELLRQIAENYIATRQVLKTPIKSSLTIRKSGVLRIDYKEIVNN